MGTLARAVRREKDRRFVPYLSLLGKMFYPDPLANQLPVCTVLLQETLEHPCVPFPMSYLILRVSPWIFVKWDSMWLPAEDHGSAMSYIHSFTLQYVICCF